MVNLKVTGGKVSSGKNKRKVRSSNNANDDKPSVFRSRNDEPAVMASFNLELLDCPICFAPFTIPIFQCENGHTACSSCCQKLISRKCPSCTLPVGSIRCRAIENVLQSARFKCRNWQYGCTKILGYGEIYLEHEKTCESSPCLCPIPGCQSFTSSTCCYYHVQFSHPDRMVTFSYDITFSISFSTDDRFLVLGVQGGDLFILHNRIEQSGNVITVSRVAPSYSKQNHCYDIVAKMEGTTHTFRSFTKNISRGYADQSAASVGFHFNFGRAAGYDGKVSLSICIWNHSTSTATAIN